MGSNKMGYHTYDTKQDEAMIKTHIDIYRFKHPDKFGSLEFVSIDNYLHDDNKTVVILKLKNWKCVYKYYNYDTDKKGHLHSAINKLSQDVGAISRGYTIDKITPADIERAKPQKPSFFKRKDFFGKWKKKDLSYKSID